MESIKTKIRREPRTSRGDGVQTELAWRRLRDDIVSGRLQPDTRLRIAKLRCAYGFGASPIREALARLSGSGFVLGLERRGFVVAPVSLEEFRDLTDVRKLLELDALRLSLQHGDANWESEVIAAFHRLTKAQEKVVGDVSTTLDAYEVANREFHEALVAGCPSPWLLQFRSIAFELSERYRRICQILSSGSRDAHREHQQLRNAAVARDARKIQKIMDQHLERTYQKVARSGRLDAPRTRKHATTSAARHTRALKS